MSADDAKNAKTVMTIAEMQAIMDNSPFIKFNGMRIVSADPQTSTVVVEMALRPEFERLPGTGQWHGGALSGFIDTAGDFALVLGTGGALVAVIGSGPGGFYVTEALLRSGTPLAVDMFEQLPVPYELIRFGVAPDPPKAQAGYDSLRQNREGAGVSFHRRGRGRTRCVDRRAARQL